MRIRFRHCVQSDSCNLVVVNGPSDSLKEFWSVCRQLGSNEMVISGLPVIRTERLVPQNLGERIGDLSLIEP
jgi:hypothetical protein